MLFSSQYTMTLYLQLRVVSHEMAHAAGVVHEQSRTDRNNFVQINFNNIQENLENNFQIAQGSNSFGLEYDYLSVMHYSRRVSSPGTVNQWLIDTRSENDTYMEAQRFDTFDTRYRYHGASIPAKSNLYC